MPTHRYSLYLPDAIREAIVAQARAEAPNECCGLLAGRFEGGRGIVDLQIPIVNEAASPISYFAEPQGLLNAFKEIRARNLELLAIYHSHPTSRAVPSRRDVEEWHYPDAMMMIVSLLEPDAAVKGWWVDEGHFDAAEITVS
jgi:proteasome lid subunit RPN8/RPN11